MLSLLELSLSLDFAQTQTQIHMPQAPLSNQWVSLFGIFFFFFGGFLCIWCCRLAMVRWRAWACRDRRGGGLSLWIGVVEGVGLWWSASVVEFWWWHKSEFGSIGDGLHDCSVAGLKFGGGFQWLRLEFGGGFRWWHMSEFGGGIRSQIGVWWWVSFLDRRGMVPWLAKFFFIYFLLFIYIYIYIYIYKILVG